MRTSYYGWDQVPVELVSEPVANRNKTDSIVMDVESMSAYLFYADAEPIRNVVLKPETAAKQPAKKTEKSTAKKPAAKKSATEKPATKKPAAKRAGGAKASKKQ